MPTSSRPGDAPAGHGPDPGLPPGPDDLLAEALRRQEIAERARDAAEQRTALVLQGGNLCLWELLIGGRRWFVDHDWFAFLGVSLDPTRDDRTAWEAVVDPDDLPTLLRHIDAIVRGESVALECSFRLRRDDGGPLWILARGTVAERDDAGAVVRMIGTMLDITRWRELEQHLRQAQKLESIGQLAAGIAHEINTPIQFIGDNTRFNVESFSALLQLIRTYRGLIAEHGDGELRNLMAMATDAADLPFLEAEVPKALAQTLEGVERVATIVRAMKEFSNPGASELAPADLNHLIENAVAISRSAWSHAAGFALALDPALPPVPLAVGDINQVLLQLITNAAQALEDAHAQQGKVLPGSIAITTRHDDVSAILAIGDDGCGMTPEVCERMYDPFFTTKAVGRGTGQGLSLVHGVVVDLHHGSIACTSAATVGTTITLRFPLGEPEST